MSYKEELKEELMIIIQDFANEEMGNRLSKFSIVGFVNSISATFIKNKEEESDFFYC